MRIIDLTGRRFGKWTVVKRVPSTKPGQTLWMCTCDCGKQKPVNGQSLLRGKSKSCACERPGNRLKPYEALYRALIRNDGYRRTPATVLLTYEEFLTFTTVKTCAYCGFEITWSDYNGYSRGLGTAYNLDRKNSSLPYSKENCVAACWECNRIKSIKYSFDEMLRIGGTLKELRTC